jgi:sugar/nucleoside kinase (ribokinase family)
MASDRGAAPELAAHELDDDWFACDALHLSGYALLREPMASAAAYAVGVARRGGARVSLDVSAHMLAGDDFRERVRTLAPDVVFGGEREHEVLGALDARWVLKRGARGIVVDGRELPAPPVDVVDATGAGDALAAGFLVGGPELALQAAARCCATVGAMPP